MRKLFLSLFILVLCLELHSQDWKAGTKVDDGQLTEQFVVASFSINAVPDAVFERMRKGGSYPANCTVSRNDLRYLRLLHVGYDNQVYRGEMVCNQAIANDLVEIFRELYRNRYQIERMVLIDNYQADDELSMRNNNTSAFCFRHVSGRRILSKHARGLAVDVNPLHNPCVRHDSRGRIVKVSPNTAEARKYAIRSTRMAHMIDRNDLCCKLFVKHGFRWGGNWRRVKDYQHFEK